VPTQKINAAVAKLQTAIRNGDSAVYRLRQQERAMQPNAYRQAIREARDKAAADIKAARQGIAEAIGQERQNLTRLSGPKADNPAERALYATRAAALAQQGPRAVLQAVRQELAAGNKTAAQEYLLIGRGQLQDIANAAELQQLQRAASDESTAAAQAALQGLNAFEADLSKPLGLDGHHLPHVLDQLGAGNPDPAPHETDGREDFGHRLGLVFSAANEAASVAGDKAMAAYDDAGAGKAPEPYAVDAEPDTADAGEGAESGDSGEGGE